MKNNDRRILQDEVEGQIQMSTIAKIVLSTILSL